MTIFHSNHSRTFKPRKPAHTILLLSHSYSSVYDTNEQASAVRSSLAPVSSTPCIVSAGLPFPLGQFAVPLLWFPPPFYRFVC